MAKLKKARQSLVLGGIFDAFNRKYFRSSLPQLPVIWHRPFLNRGHRRYAGQFVVFEDDSVCLLINPLLRRLRMQRYTSQTILHEMAHAHLWHQGYHPNIYNGHGKYFQKEMRRLVRAGAFDVLW